MILQIPTNAQTVASCRSYEFMEEYQNLLCYDIDCGELEELEEAIKKGYNYAWIAKYSTYLLCDTTSLAKKLIQMIEDYMDECTPLVQCTTSYQDCTLY